ncbi:MAG: hypothetical protein KDC76_02410 [Bacteroidetes bacterium]|nr:hypothetical protein [Bacteroidota bacterium]
MNKKKTIGILLIATALMLAGCYKDKDELLYGTTDCQPVNVSFSTDILPMIRTECATSGCHVQGGSAPGIFENYDQIKAKIDAGSFQRRVIQNRDMPPATPMTDCQIAFLQTWLNDGAPNN